jgi:hypothetical protein
VAEVRTPRPAEGDTILLEHGVQHLQTRSDRELEQLGGRIDEQIDQWEVPGRINSGGPNDCARLLHGGS